MEFDYVFELEDNLDDVIKLEGNFFIMDSEQLISNPFQEMQQEAVNEASSHGNGGHQLGKQRVNSMTEKLTIVKNNVCENHYQMAASTLERQRTTRLKQLHDHANRLRHEVKLLDLDRQRHTVEVKKRLDPQRDYSYDESQIHNTERRLGANIASFYLDKKLKYPMRVRSMKDIRVTPTISKARAKIRTNALARPTPTEENGSSSAALRHERAQTAKTASSTAQTSSSAAFRRRGSRSAPLHTRNTRPDTSKTLFPAISTGRATAGASRTLAAGVLAAPQDDNGAGRVTDNNQHQHQQQVKFAFENPLKILASSEESANMFARSCPYYPGSTKAVNFGWDDSSDDEDTLSEPERIDLKAILFPDDKQALRSQTHSSLSQHQIWALRKAQGPAPKLSTTKKEEETNMINAKIDKFLERLALARLKRRRRKDSDSDESEEEREAPVKFGGGNTVDAAPLASAVADALTKSTGISTQTKDHTNSIQNTEVNRSINSSGVIQNTTTATTTNNNASNTKATSTADLLRDDTKLSSQSEGDKNPSPAPVAHNHHHHNNMGARVTTFIRSDYQTQQATTGGVAAPVLSGAEDDQEEADTPRKYSWRCIRGKQSDGKLRGTYRTEDLVIQALTGVPISNAIGTQGLPMHSASRALRHSATFKMHKIVEKLIQDRTKYERHQVEEIKRQQQMETSPSSPTAEQHHPNHTMTSRVAAAGGGGGGSVMSSRRVSKVAMTSVSR